MQRFLFAIGKSDAINEKNLILHVLFVIIFLLTLTCAVLNPNLPELNLDDKVNLVYYSISVSYLH